MDTIPEVNDKVKTIKKVFFLVILLNKKPKIIKEDISNSNKILIKAIKVLDIIILPHFSFLNHSINSKGTIMNF